MFGDQNHGAKSSKKSSPLSKLSRQKQNRRNIVSDNDTSSRYGYYLITPILILICFAMSFFVLRHYWLRKPLRLLQIKTITVAGRLHYVNQAKLERQLRQLSPLYFFNIKPDLISQQLRQQQPWIRSVKVRRVWPSSIMLDINEYHPLAIWNNQQLLDKDGEEFMALAKDSLLAQTLPQLIGAPGTEMEVWRAYLACSKILAPLDLKIKTVSLSIDQQWQLQLRNGLTIYIGHQNMLRRLNNFSELYTLLLKLYKKSPASFDLRYQHAIAVK
jgi:cell division protein FtsQ